MEILQQCQIWNGNGEYKKIVDALETIPAEERTPEMDSDLARAYNNLAAPSDRELFKKAIALLQPHEEYFAGDHCWNFRMGYAYYYLDQEGRALRYFEKALEARPGDEDTQELIESCKKGISLPRFAMCFRERTEIFWETFAEMEAELRQMMDEDKDRTRGAEIVAQMQGALNNVFDEVSFEMGFNGEKHELVLTPEGDKVNLFELVYFQKHAPKEVLEHWNILVGRQPMQNIGLRTDDGWEISGDDVLVWLEDKGENSFAISAYCEKLLPMLQENEGRVWWMLTTLTDQVLGEIPHMRYIESFDVLDETKAEPYFLMSQLPDKLRELGLELSTDPEAYLENYLGYQMKPNEDTDADWRLDVMVGSTNCVPLINGYLSADNDYMDNLHADGVVAGFFCYPLDTLREEEGSQKIFDFRDKLEEVFLVDDGPDVLTLTGGATGLYCGYVDFIAWDIRSALNMAKEFFEGTDVPWASFHTFRREAGSVTLKDTQDNEPETEAEEDNELEKNLEGMDYIPYTPQNAEAFYEQLEKWNDEDEYTRCIQALNAVPKDWRDYRFAYALARALENYAIIGDHDEGTPNYKGDKALLRAIDVLESVRDEGQHKAEWNMRMAYGYQYLYGQEEKAISYAERWAELDPDDKNAALVIEECTDAINKRENADGDSAVGRFAGLVLLSKAEWDKEQFIKDLQEVWGIVDEELDEKVDEDNRDAVVMRVGDMMLVATLFKNHIPNNEAEINAENNYMWPEAVEVAKNHKAHIMVAVLGEDEKLLERGKLFTKVMATCCKQKYVTGVFTSGVVFSPRFYEGFAGMIKENELPIFNWIWFGLYRSEGGLNGYTYGMDVFGKEEMEVLNADAEPEALRDFLASLASYVLACDVTLQDGETIGFSADDKHTITRSPGVSLPEEQMTLKISYEPSEGGPDDGNNSDNKQIEEKFSQPEDVYDEPSEVAEALMEYLDCECTYFPSMADDDPIMSAYSYAKREGIKKGFVPVLIRADDETLLECLVMNSEPENDDCYEFDLKAVEEYRKKLLAAPVKEAETVLKEMVGRRKVDAADDDMDWEEDVLGAMEGGFENSRFSSYWNDDTEMTYPVILAKIPVKNPWEIFAYLPFGNWNDCPDTPELMAVTKYWFEQYGAVPAVMSHDELELLLPAPVGKEKAMDLAVEMYGLCPDMDQNFDEIGALADSLWQSKVWYFWWD